MGRGKYVASQRSKTLSASLTLSLDDEREVLIKCHRMFNKELDKILNQIEVLSKAWVATHHKRYSKTGALRDSIRKTPIKGVQGGGKRIAGNVVAGGARAPYAKYVHNGTEPHLITPKAPGGRLAFLWRYRTGRVNVPTWVEVPVRGNTRGVRSRSRGGRNVRINPTVFDNDRGVRSGRRKMTDEQRARGLGGSTGEYVPGTAGNPNIEGKLYRRVTRRGRGRIKDKVVWIDAVNHPGYDGDPFLTICADAVIRQYGGRVNVNKASLRKPRPNYIPPM